MGLVQLLDIKVSVARIGSKQSSCKLHMASRRLYADAVIGMLSDVADSDDQILTVMQFQSPDSVIVTIHYIVIVKLSMGGAYIMNQSVICKLILLSLFQLFTYQVRACMWVCVCVRVCGSVHVYTCM